MWTLHPKHEMANSGFLFHWTPFDREYPHPLNDLESVRLVYLCGNNPKLIKKILKIH